MGSHFFAQNMTDNDALAQCLYPLAIKESDTAAAPHRNPHTIFAHLPSKR